MANTYSSTMYSDALAPCSSNCDRVIPFEVTHAAEIVTGDVLNLCKVPKGYTVTGIAFTTSAAVGSGTGAIKIGTNDGTTNDDDSLVASVAATGALIKPLVPPVVAQSALLMAAVGTVYATMTLASGPTTGITLKGIVTATPYLA